MHNPKKELASDQSQSCLAEYFCVCCTMPTCALHRCMKAAGVPCLISQTVACILVSLMMIFYTGAGLPCPHSIGRNQFDKNSVWFLYVRVTESCGVIITNPMHLQVLNTQAPTKTQRVALDKEQNFIAHRFNIPNIVQLKDGYVRKVQTVLISLFDIYCAFRR